MKGKNKKNSNRMFIICGAAFLLLIICIIFGRGGGKAQVDAKENTLKVKVNGINEISVVGSRVENQGNYSSIFVKIKNNSKKTFNESSLKLTVFDKKGNELLTSIIENVKKLEAGEEVEFQVTTTNDITKASKYFVEKNKETKK